MITSDTITTTGDYLDLDQEPTFSLHAFQTDDAPVCPHGYQGFAWASPKR